MTSDYKENRQIRIFISSTFRDMMKERDYLITRIFPELRRYCEERDISLFELDLRWGVTQEESENSMTFKICLNEVDNTRPFFIGLIGERYGWVPDDETIEKMKPSNVFEEYEWLMGELKKKTSVTEVEMQQGAFLPEEEINAYFYIRSPKMPTPEEFCEPKGSDGEKKLLELKEKIKTDSRYDFNEYETMEQLGQQVEEDFKALVDKLFPSQGHLSIFEKERLQQHIYLKSKTRTYVSNSQWMKYLDDFADSGKKETAITGESGMGKAAFLANWIVRRKQKQVKDENIIYHFIGISQSGGDYYYITMRLIDEIRALYDLPPKNEEEDKDATFTDDLRNILFSVPKDKKLIIVIDSLDRLDEEQDVYLLNWLPEHPANVKFIFSSTNGDSAIESLKRRTDKQLEIVSLSAQSRKELIVDYFKKFSKKMTGEQMDRIVADKKSENPAIMTALLDNLRIFGNFDIFDKQIDERLSHKTSERLFNLFLENIESLFKDKSMVERILSLIAVSRFGLTETEIVHISKVPVLYWSQLSNCMSVHLITLNGVVTFSSGVMAQTVKGRYLSNTDVVTQYRREICEYMKTEEKVSIIRKCDELPYQLMELKEWDELYNLILQYEVFDQINLKNRNELARYWRVLRELDDQKYNIKRYLYVKLDDPHALIEFYDDLCSFTKNALLDASLGLVFAEEYLNACKKLPKVKSTEEAGENANYKIGYAYNAIGNSYSAAKNYDKAIEYYEKALEIWEDNPREGGVDEATAYNNIGTCYYKMSKYFKAIRYYKEALEIISKKYGKEDYLTAELYRNLGECCSWAYKFGKAMKYCKKSVKITEKKYGTEHPKIARAYYTYADVAMKLAFTLNMFGLGILRFIFKKSLKLFETYRTIWRKNFSEKTDSVARSYNNSGLCYFNIKDYKKAVEYNLKSADLFTKIFGNDCKEALSAYFFLGQSYYMAKEYIKSIEAFEKGIIADGGGDGQKEDVMKFIIANCHKELGNYKEAIDIYIDQADDHSYLGAARCYEKLGEKEKAYAYYELALSEFEERSSFLEKITKKAIKKMFLIKDRNEKGICKRAIRKLAKQGIVPAVIEEKESNEDETKAESKEEKPVFRKVDYENGMVYEGFYLGDKRHGKGRYTNHSEETGNLHIYDGDWYMGDRTGKGITATIVKDSIMINEGDHVNGKLHGKGRDIFKDIHGIVVYEGGWVDGKREGMGIEIKEENDGDRDVTEGEWKNDYFEAESKYESYDGTEDLVGYAKKLIDKVKFEARGGSSRSSEGDADDSTPKWDIAKYSEGVYEGYYVNGKFNGIGKYTYNNGDTYEGDFVNGLFHGKGKYIIDKGPHEGEIYEGDYFEDRREGKGRYTFKSGNYYEGDFANNFPNGKGKKVYVDGKVEEGNWKDGELLEKINEL